MFFEHRDRTWSEIPIEERRIIVECARASCELEGFEPNEHSRKVDEDLINLRVTLDDLDKALPIPVKKHASH